MHWQVLLYCVLFLFSLNFVIVCGLSDWCESVYVFIIFFICIAVGVPGYQKGRGLNSINRCNPSTLLCLSQGRTSIFNIICREWRWEVNVRFVDVGIIVDHHYLNFLSIKNTAPKLKKISNTNSAQKTAVNTGAGVVYAVPVSYKTHNVLLKPGKNELFFSQH